jgi:pSer/pThr/pTyr-binding forkhead associated (FHA) protein
MPQLVFRYGDGGNDEVFDLREDQIGIGREADNPIVIDSTYVSQHHARLSRSGDGSYTLYDLGSNNGTYVNDRAITTVQLKHGDQIKFGVLEVDFVDEPDEGVPVDVDRTQRLTLDDVSQNSSQYWNAAVENKRKELEALEKRIDELGSSHQGASSNGSTPEPVDRKASEGKRDELAEKIAILEGRHENIQQQLLEQATKLESIKEQEIPAAKGDLEGVQGQIAAAHGQLAEAQEKLAKLDSLEDEMRKLQSKIASLYSEHDMKKVSLQHSVDEFLRTEAKLDEVK